MVKLSNFINYHVYYFLKEKNIWFFVSESFNIYKIRRDKLSQEVDKYPIV